MSFLFMQLAPVPAWAPSGDTSLRLLTGKEAGHYDNLENSGPLRVIFKPCHPPIDTHDAPKFS